MIEKATTQNLCDCCGSIIEPGSNIYQIEYTEAKLCNACYDDYCHFCIEDGGDNAAPKNLFINEQSI